MTRQSIIYKLAGGLGNQLFAVSEGFLLHKSTGRKIQFDISSVEHGLNPEAEIDQWISGLGDWFQIGYYHNEINRRIGINLSSATDDQVKSVDVSNYYFLGWRPNIQVVKLSGLFERGELPQSWKRFHDSSVRQYSHGLHLRLKDYLNSNALGGNIALDKAYLRKITKDLELDLRFRELLVVSDDAHNARLLMSQSNLDLAKVEVVNRTPIQDLCQLSRCAKIYASPSTFSFWSAYFSNAETFFPKPFFYSNPRWESKLIDPSWKQIARIGLADKWVLEFRFFAQEFLRILRI